MQRVLQLRSYHDHIQYTPSIRCRKGDALDDGKLFASVLFGGPEGGKVSGSRLGRDHKPTDVPNHFVRDIIMDYINSEVKEDKKQTPVQQSFPTSAHQR